MEQFIDPRVTCDRCLLWLQSADRLGYRLTGTLAQPSPPHAMVSTRNGQITACQPEAWTPLRQAPTFDEQTL